MGGNVGYVQEGMRCRFSGIQLSDLLTALGRYIGLNYPQCYDYLVRLFEAILDE